MNIEINISLRKFIKFQVIIISAILIICAIGYTVLSFGAPSIINKFFKLFDVGREQSIPTYFSVFNLLVAAALIAVIAIYEKKNDLKSSRYWISLSLIFIFLALDEALSFHEKLTYIQLSLEESSILPKLLTSHQWIPLGIIFVIITGIYFIPFIKSLSRETFILFSLAGFIFIFGAIGLELSGSLMLSNELVESKNELIYMFRRIFEEGFEMFGIAIFNIALYKEILNRKISLILINDY